MLEQSSDLGQPQLSKVLEAESEQGALDAAVSLVSELVGGTVVGVLRGRAEHISSVASDEPGALTSALFIEALWQVDSRLVGQKQRDNAILEHVHITPILLREGERVLGAICAAGGLPFSQQEEAQIAVLQLAFMRTIQRIRRLAETRLLYEISLRLGSKLDVAQLVHDVLDLVKNTFGARSSRVFLNDGRTGSLSMLSVEPPPPSERPAQDGGTAPPSNDWEPMPNRINELLLWPQAEGSTRPIETLRIPLDGTIAGFVVRLGEGYIRNNPYDLQFPEVERETGVPLTKLVCVPLKHYDRTVGALMLINQHDDPDFTEDDQQLLTTIGSILAIMLTNARLYQRAVRDALTGAYNRGAFEMRLRDHWGLWEQTGAGFSLVILDLDNFKQINDRFGHTTGDMVLRTVTRLLWEALREEDSIFRYGGEEFCAVLSHLTDPDVVAKVAERIRSTLDREIVISSLVRVKISASVGVAIHPLHGAQNAQALLEYADDASYQAKRLGKNQVVIAALP